MIKTKCTTAATLLSLALSACVSTETQSAEPAVVESYSGPIIDVHLHATEDPPPFGLCLPWVTQFPAWDTRNEWVDEFERVMIAEPPCDDPIPAVPSENDELLNATIEVMEAYNVIGILSGSAEETRHWHQAAPERFLPSLDFQLGREGSSLEEVRAGLETGDFIALGEISNQYAGISPDDPGMEPFWSLAEELDIPVAIHMGEGTVGTAYLPFDMFRGYRASLSNPLHLEEVLIRHPKLRVSVMHYGSPFVDEMIALMASHPQVYVDIGGIQWFYPTDFFYDHLRNMVDAGFGKRIMFGSDAAEWPGVIKPSIDIIDDAPFLTIEQKADIFYNNAARFFRLSEEDIARHQALSGG